jgi:hypothetical protein
LGGSIAKRTLNPQARQPGDPFIGAHAALEFQYGPLPSFEAS